MEAVSIMLIQDIWTPAVGEALLLKREPEVAGLKEDYVVGDFVDVTREPRLSEGVIMDWRFHACTAFMDLMYI